MLFGQYPAVTEGPNGDHDLDGIRNGIEYAFGLNPTVFTLPGALPQPVPAGATLTTSYTQPAGVTGVTYGAEWSRNLTTWTAIPDTGSGSTHTFTLNVIGEPKVFLRHTVTIAP